MIDNDTVPEEKSPRDRFFQRDWFRITRRMGDNPTTKSPIT